MSGEKTGITSIGLLQVAFIVLKLCGVIRWKWVWVLSPIWIDAVIVFVIATIMVIADRRRK